MVWVLFPKEEDTTNVTAVSLDHEKRKNKMWRRRAKNWNQLVDDNGNKTENCSTDNLISRNKTTEFLFFSISTLSLFIVFCYQLMTTIIIFLVVWLWRQQKEIFLQLRCFSSSSKIRKYFKNWRMIGTDVRPEILTSAGCLWVRKFLNHVFNKKINIFLTLPEFKWWNLKSFKPKAASTCEIS